MYATVQTEKALAPQNTYLIRFPTLCYPLILRVANTPLEGQDMTTITNLVRWLALNGFGSSQVIGKDAWLSFGFIHFAFNHKFELHRVQFGVSAG
jgi:hypothetical protein